MIIRDLGFVSGTIGYVYKIETIELEHTLCDFMGQFMEQTDGPHLGGSRLVFISIMSFSVNIVYIRSRDYSFALLRFTR